MANTTLTPTQVGAYLLASGLPADQLATGIAIAGAESSYDYTQRNKIGASGLFQILESAHPEFKKAWTTSGWTSWEDPMTNTAMAIQVYQKAGNSWHPWQSYTTGAYLKYMPAATAAANQVLQEQKSQNPTAFKQWIYSQLTPTDQSVVKQLGGAFESVLKGVAGAGNELGTTVSATGPALADSVAGLGSELASLSDFFGKLLLPSTWMRVGAGIAGVVLLGMSLWVFSKEVKG